MVTAQLPDDLFTDIQATFRKTPVVLVGSGFSCGYDLPGMGALGQHLADVVHASLSSEKAKAIWVQTADSCRENLEAGLNTIPHGAAGRDEVVAVVRNETAKLILEKTAAAESIILSNPIGGNHAPSRLLNRLFGGSPQNAEGIHVITTNYDTLLELFCDLANLPLDTGFTGFRRRKPRSGPLFQTQYSRVRVAEKRQQQVDHRTADHQQYR